MDALFHYIGYSALCDYGALVPVYHAKDASDPRVDSYGSYPVPLGYAPGQYLASKANLSGLDSYRIPSSLYDRRTLWS